ncbi:MAG: hypothetical protein Unbinned1190contig1000_46 [Prokaryotic dsDNA virus sp.]|nr:MAG: hypothetical protein Unbinned1190contig1000_46 [Prokaryotic dsDNA virus sp.]
MSTSLNLSQSSDRGDFSGGLYLAQNAMQELGDAEASYFITANQQRFLNYANRVVTDVNRHPMFLDLLDAAYDNQQGSISADSQTLVLTGSPTVTFNTYTPVKVAGAGFSSESGGGAATTAGDLYSFVIRQTTDGSGNSVANSWRLADTAGVTVTDAVVSHPYSTRIKRYTELSADTYRPIDDEVVVLGIKSYFMKDDSDTNNAGLITLAQNEYTLAINSWLGSIVNVQGNLTVEISEYT